jgi:hypothetical protein
MASTPTQSLSQSTLTVPPLMPIVSDYAISSRYISNLKRRFESIDEQNDFLEHWEVKWAASRIHGNERRQVQAMFEEERCMHPAKSPC